MMIRVSLIRFISTIAFGAAFMALVPMAYAQDVAPPSEAQLTTPGAKTTTTTTTTQVTMPAQPEASKNTGAVAGDPCPAPKAAAAGSPDDMAKVQEEIDRFTLCVQRAQLLERLNESALKNQAADDAALGYKAPSVPGLPGAQRSSGAGLPPLPANALAGADVTPIAPAATTTTTTSTTITPAAAEEAPAPKPENKAWTIREIYGSSSGVEAKLVSPDGDEVKAKGGMKLPDGKTVVVRITPAGVTVRDGKGTKTLDWAKS